MPRYFIEVSYHGKAYSGSQIQQNANSVQAELEKALKIYFRKDFNLTGSSRTDAGVHALQNFFHVDVEGELPASMEFLYNLNSILPPDMVIKSVQRVKDEAHCRFDAIYRSYKYHVYRNKDPFLLDWAYYYPYKLDVVLMNQAACLLTSSTDFSAFSKRNSQVKSFNCRIMESSWTQTEGGLIYRVKGDRFLRGMVRGLVGTMLRVGTGRLSPEEFGAVIESGNQSLVDFSAPAHGLFLVEVGYPEKIFLDN